jgi:dienelactone hydrolase
LDQIRPHLDEQNIIASGFSCGSTTASLAATREPTKFQCAILLDPWLHVDHSSKGIEFDFPPEAFGAAWPIIGAATEHLHAKDATDCKGKGLDVPSVFIMSEQFEGYKKLYGATQRLADQINASSRNKDKNQRSEVHVIPGTAHQNFCDVIFWLPRRLSRKVFQLGSADAYDAYESILKCTVEFLERF